MTEELNTQPLENVTPVTNTLDDLLNNPFGDPIDAAVSMDQKRKTLMS